LLGATLIQLVQYWSAFERLLKRTMEHAVGAAFRNVPAFARDSVDHQASRSPDDALRWSSCALLYCDLMRSAGSLQSFDLFEERRLTLTTHAASLSALRAHALRVLGDRLRARQPAGTLEPEDALTCAVIETARSVTELLGSAWASVAKAQQSEQASRISAEVELSWPQAVGFALSPAAGGRALEPEQGSRPVALAIVHGSSVPPPGAPAEAESRAPSSAPAPKGGSTVDALTPGESAFSGGELRWLRSAQTFVATVVTLLIHRHIRQFRYFLWVTTLGSLLLLLAVTSYPFEPYRLLLTYMWIITGSVVGVCLWVYMRMDRNTLMSHITGTSPNEVTLDSSFWIRIFAWGVVPLLSVAAAQYPEIANFLFNVVSPFTRALR
jgi:hypothetical protein